MCLRPPVGELAPRRHRLLQLSAKLGAQPDPLDERQPPRLVLTLRPDLRRLPGGGERIPVGVDRDRLLSCGDERRAGASVVTRGEPVLRDRR